MSTAPAGSASSNAPQVAAKLLRAGEQVRIALTGELDDLGSRIAAEMRRRAPTFRSTLANSIAVRSEDALVRFVSPGVDYALWVEKGRKPGKGLPRLTDVSAASAKAWLEAMLVAGRRKANPKYRRAREGSRRRGVEDQELVDAYMAWSRAVKFRGIKARPFVAPTAAAFRGVVPQSLADAVRRGVQRAGLGQGGGTAPTGGRP
jgi:hypothetical protein